jgi:hypothetical protein
VIGCRNFASDGVADCVWFAIPQPTYTRLIP